MTFNKDLSRKLLHASLNAMHDGIILLDSDGRIVFWNDWMTEMSGQTFDDTIGKALDQTFPEQAGGRLMNAVRWALNNGLPSFLSPSLNRQPLPLVSEGRQIEQSIHVTPLARVRKHPCCLISIKDVTALVEKEHLLRARARQLEKEKERAQHYLDTAQTIMVALDTDGNITMINRTGCALLGRTEDELLGRNWFATCLPQPEGMAKVFPLFRQIIEGQADSAEYFENTVRCKDGTKRLVAWRNAFLRDKQGGIAGTLSSGEDITDRRRLEEAFKGLATTFAGLAGKPFFEAVSRHLAGVLGVDYVFVGKLAPTGNSVNVVGGYGCGETMGEMSYALADTPCEQVMGNTFCIYPENIQTQFPKDFLLGHLEVEGYAGTPIFDQQRKPIGILVALHSRPLSNPQVISELFNVFSERIAAEMQRSAAEDEFYQLNAELSRSERKFRAIAENGPFGIAISDLAQNNLYLNPMFTQMFGYTLEDIPTMESWWPLAYPDEQYRNEARQRWQSATAETMRDNNQMQPTEELVTCKDGKQRVVEFRMNFVEDLNIVIFIDVSARVAASQALNEAKQSAEKASHAKSVFLANMSHELRTPLNAILGFSDVLRRTPGLSETQQKNLAIIHKSGDHLLSIINDILEIAKIEAGRVELDLAPFDFSAMILDVTNMLRLRAEEKGLRLLVDQPSGFPCHLVADEAKLRQILINLISNAIKATEQGGVVLRLGLKHNHAERLLIEVEDSGCGIAPADQGRILEPFVQTSDQDRQQGTGLGLAITRQFVELMGGSLSLTSTVGQGSTFRVDIPVQTAQPEDIPQAPKARGEVISLAPGQPNCRVLVVEDDPTNQLLLMNLLEGMGFPASLAENGIEAVEQFQSWHPHFIWMDRRMPVMDGDEATRQIRALPGGEAVKIAAVTASSFKEEDEELLAAGFNAIVHKPFRPGQIFECMERLLGLRFVRAEVEGADTPLPVLSPAAMAALPQHLRQNLAQALLILDGERILEVIDAIAQTDTELGEALRLRVQNYAYESILALLQSGPPAAEEGEAGTSPRGTQA